MAMSGGKDDGSPMMEMNTTPLIDVMLVLLIMFIITIPVATHSVTVNLPSPSQAPPNLVHPDKNKLVLTATNTILWNGTPVTYGQVVTLLQATKALSVEPELQFQPEPYANYEVANQVIKIISDSKVTKFGFVGNENFQNFTKAQ